MSKKANHPQAILASQESYLVELKKKLQDATPPAQAHMATVRKIGRVRAQVEKLQNNVAEQQKALEEATAKLAEIQAELNART